jgi:hypothetical protein
MIKRTHARTHVWAQESLHERRHTSKPSLHSRTLDSTAVSFTALAASTIERTQLHADTNNTSLYTRKLKCKQLFKHAYTHQLTHLNTLARSLASKQARLHTRTIALTHTCTHACTRARQQKQNCTHMQARKHICTVTGVGRPHRVTHTRFHVLTIHARLYVRSLVRSHACTHSSMVYLCKLGRRSQATMIIGTHALTHACLDSITYSPTCMLASTRYSKHARINERFIALTLTWTHHYIHERLCARVNSQAHA